MSKKWYNMFVSLGSDASQQPPPADDDPSAASSATPNAAQAIADIAASIAPQPAFAQPVSNPTSFDQIYSAAEIQPPAHGFTVMKVADMLRSEHIRNLPRDVKRSSVLVALEAAGASIQDVIQDAIKRDRALDGYERVREKALLELETRKNQENQQIQAEIDRIVAEHKARMQANTDEVAKERESFYGWRLKKQEEEQKISDTVSYFVTENPITTGGSAAAPASSAKPDK